MIATPWVVAGGALAGAALVRKVRGSKLDRAARAVEEIVAEVLAVPTVAVRERWGLLLGRRRRLGALVDHARGDVSLPDTRRATARALSVFPTGVVGEVLLVGLTGVGKSTLVNALIGAEIAPVGTGAPVTRGVQRYFVHDRALIVDTEGLEVGGRTAHLVTLARLADAVWYCVEAESGRVHEGELALLAELSAVAPVVIVLTRALEESPPLLAPLREFGEVVPVLARERGFGGMTIPASGVDELIAAHRRVLSASARPDP